MERPALFINGIYSDVLEEILKGQSQAPDQTLFLQPYSVMPIRLLKDNPPTPDDPVRLYASTTYDLAQVSYSADIVGWEDKTDMSQARREELAGIINEFQPGEGGEHNEIPLIEWDSLNLLSIQRLVRLAQPFSVTELIKVSDGQPLSANRSRSGGWSPVRLRRSASIDPPTDSEFRFLVRRAGLEMDDDELAQLKALHDAFQERMRPLHEADLDGEEVAGIFLPSAVGEATP